MPIDETARIRARSAHRLIATGLVLACLAPSVATAQAPVDPKEAEKLKQKQRQPPPPNKPGNAPQIAPKGPPPEARRGPPSQQQQQQQGNQPRQPQQQQSAPSFDRRPDGQPRDRRGSPAEIRRVDPQVAPRNLPPPPAVQQKLPPPTVQGGSKQPPPPPGSNEVQGASKPFLPPGRPLPPPGKPATVTGKDVAPPPPESLRRGPGAPGGPSSGRPPVLTDGQRPKTVPINIDQVRSARIRSAGPGGQTVLREPGDRTIIKQGNRVFVTRNETTVIQNFAPGAKSARRPDGVTETVFARPDGSRVFTEVDRHGRLVRRFRRDAGGREITFVDNRRFYRNVAIGAGAALLATAVIVSLPRPVHALPREKYVVEYVNASDDDIYECLTAPPIEKLEREYSLDEIRYSVSLRDRVRRVDLDNVNFETGSFEVTPDQFGKLERIARAIGRALEANPAEVFLIEGHTDAVGAEEDNVSLSDRRAEAVARILVEHFQIPVENLVTQGYGEQFPKVETQGPERLNRRVAMRRITPLLSQKE